jgi:hypothetical protein
MSRNLPSSPTVEYGAPYLPITTRSTTMNIALDEVSAAALPADTAQQLLARVKAGDTRPDRAGHWSAVTLTSDDGHRTSPADTASTD